MGKRIKSEKWGGGMESQIIEEYTPLRIWLEIRQAHPLQQPRTQGICSWGAKYPGMAWSRDPRILHKMAYCLLGSV